MELEPRFHANKHVFNLISDCLKDYRELNEQAMTHISLLENPYGDFSYQYTKRQSNVKAIYLDHQATRRHAMAENIDVVVSEVLTDGFTSSYPCAEPTLNPEDGFYVSPVPFSCDECSINLNGIDLKIIA